MAIIRVDGKLSQLAFNGTNTRKHSMVARSTRYTRLAKHYAKLQCVRIELGDTDTFKCMRMNGRGDTVYQRNFLKHRKNVYTLKIRKIFERTVDGRDRTPYAAKVYPSFI